MAASAVASVGFRPRRLLYIALSLLTAAIVLVGFWPDYYGALGERLIDRPLVVHFHAVVFTGWLVLFAAQAGLAATGRLQVHLRLGKIGAWYGGALILVGVYTGVVRSAAQPAGEGEILLYVSLLDMVVFSSFFAAAIWFRRKPDLHKRLMTVAAVALAIAAVGRMDFFPAPPLGRYMRLLVWSSPILIAIGHDVLQRRRVHPVYVVGLLAFVVRIWTVPLAGTPEFARFAEWIYGLAR